MKIFLDLDGVLAKCHEAALAWHGVDIEPGRSPMHETVNRENGENYTRQEFWEAFPYDFWQYLDKTDICDQLVNDCIAFAGEENVFIATKPVPTSACYDGKSAWVRRELPHLKEKLILIYEKELLAPGILIDDSLENRDAFTNAGGVGIIVPRPWNGYGHMDDTFMDGLATMFEMSERILNEPSPIGIPTNNPNPRNQ